MRITIARTLFTLLVALIMSGLATACSSNLESTTETTMAGPVTVTVNLLGNRFDTDSITIAAGSTIIFHNTTSADHGIISEVFDADLRPGQDFHYTFEAPGVYEVRSRTHASASGIYLRVNVE